MKCITVEMLKAHDACSSQVELFARVFPRGAPVSMRSFAKARKAGLNPEWTARFLWGPARVEYEKACAAAWADEKVRAPALAEYEKADDAALVAALRGEEER